VFVTAIAGSLPKTVWYVGADLHHRCANFSSFDAQIHDALINGMLALRE